MVEFQLLSPGISTSPVQGAAEEGDLSCLEASGLSLWTTAEPHFQLHREMEMGKMEQPV